MKALVPVFLCLRSIYLVALLSRNDQGENRLTEKQKNPIFVALLTSFTKNALSASHLNKVVYVI